MGMVVRESHRPVVDRSPTAVRLDQVCAHCGLGITSATEGSWLGTRSTANNEGMESDLVFCCRGCAGAYALIHELGLDTFYSLRDQNASEVSPVRQRRRSQMLADLEGSGVPVEHFSDGTCRIRLAVDGLHCAACSWLIESVQPSVRGWKSGRVRMSDATLELIYDPDVVSPVEIADRIARLGYGLSPVDLEHEGAQGDREIQRGHWIGLASAAFLAANSMWIAISLYAGEASGMDPSHAIFLRWCGALLGLLSAIFPGRIFFRSAWESLRAGVPHVDVPVALGLAVGTVGSLVGAALGHGNVYFDSLASLVFLLRVGRYIQFRAQYRTGMSLAKLLRMNDSAAVRIREDGTRQAVPANRLRSNDVIEVLPCQVLPADGVVIEGTSVLQTALITGESRPVQAVVGTQVVGGTANMQSPLIVRVTAAGENSRVGKLQEMVRQATAQRTPLVQLADRIGGVFVMVVLGLACGTFLVWCALAGYVAATERTVALLTIACPCALALAAPLVITVALGRAAKEQIWIRDGGALERLAKPGVIWFDKTGTLTYGELQVIQWRGELELLSRVAALESHSEHPVGLAIIAHMQSVDPAWNANLHRVHDVEQRYGHGITGSVDGQRISIGSMQAKEERLPVDDTSHSLASQTISIQVEGKFCGALVLHDRQRPEAIGCLKDLRDRGWQIGLISGDSAELVDAMGATLREAGVPLVACLSQQSPEDKIKTVVDSKPTYGTTVMVGDGINDAAALAAADVGIAIRGGGEICLRDAPIYIPSHQLHSIVRLIDASRQTVRGIYRCFAVSLTYNAITLSLAMAGWIHPLVAALFMPLSGISVLAMALLAKTFPPQGNPGPPPRNPGPPQRKTG